MAHFVHDVQKKLYKMLCVKGTLFEYKVTRPFQGNFLELIINSRQCNKPDLLRTEKSECFCSKLLGIEHIKGGFALLVYSLAQTKDTKEGIYEINNTSLTRGILTLLLIWSPACLRVFLLARKRNWAGMTTCKCFLLILNYILLTLILPVFNALM